MNEIIGLDLSLKRTGYCKCNADSPFFEITDLGSISTKTQDDHREKGKLIVDKVYPLQERISIILSGLEEKGIAQPYFTKLVGMENYAFKAIGQGATMLGELQGVIRFFMWSNEVKKIVVAPQTVKAHVNQGGSEKCMVAMHARIKYSDAIIKWGMEIQNDDQADALVICELTWLYYRWVNNLTIDQNLDKKVISRLTKFQESDENK